MHITASVLLLGIISYIEYGPNEANNVYIFGNTSYKVIWKLMYHKRRISDLAKLI